jgi:outer membrane lipoprotein-sorting protein
VSSTTAIIAGTISANSVQAAPMTLAKSVTAVTVVKGSTAAALTLTLVKGTMKTMTWLKIKFAIGVGIVALLAGGAVTVAISQTSGDDKLTPQEIFKNAQDAYASLSSYSDEGKTVAIVNGMTLTTTFNIKLSRPNSFRVEWSQATDYFTNGGVVWSDGSDIFMGMKYSQYLPKPAKYNDKESALSAASGVSASASATVPGTFFKMNWGNQFGGSIANEEQQADEKVGDIDCYVFKSELKGTTKTLWIARKIF